MFAEIRTDGEKPAIDGRIVVYSAPYDGPEPVADVGHWPGEWDEHGPILTDADQSLAASGYRRTGGWDIHPWGYRAPVEAV